MVAGRWKEADRLAGRLREAKEEDRWKVAVMWRWQAGGREQTGWQAGVES